MLIAACVLLPGCALRGSGIDAPAEGGRHRAALAIVTVANHSPLPLAIAFRMATPPLQEVTIGRVAAGARARMAPVPAGEPIILVARRADGAEYQGEARSLALDAEFVWDIPIDATFQMPERRK